MRKNFRRADRMAEDVKKMLDIFPTVNTLICEVWQDHF